jgi:hypothetical protein
LVAVDESARAQRGDYRGSQTENAVLEVIRDDLDAFVDALREGRIPGATSTLR